MNGQLRVYKTDPYHVLPSYATAESACFDVAVQLGGKAFVMGYSPNNVKIVREVVDGEFVIQPGERILAPTGLIFELEPGTVLKLHARGSTGIKLGLMLANSVGIVDADYFHETFIPLYNMSHVPVRLTHGDRVAQAEVHRYERMCFVEIDTPPQQTTERAGGFGSTGQTVITSDSKKQLEIPEYTHSV